MNKYIKEPNHTVIAKINELLIYEEIKAQAPALSVCLQCSGALKKKTPLSFCVYCPFKVFPLCR